MHPQLETLLEIQDIARTGLLGAPRVLAPSRVRVSGQPRASLSYGIPSAAGGIARPTTPASTMIVTM